MTTEATDFKRASQAVWDAMAPGWDERHAFFEETARPVTERMLEHLAPTSGQTILELASGTGVVGFAATALVGASGRVILSDFSQAMVDLTANRAREHGITNVDSRRLDAERLELDDDSVDGVLCRWGYMLMGDPAAALRETRRVLRQGGRLSCAVFGSADRNPWAALPAAILRERGQMPPAQAAAPGILALADRQRLTDLITNAGFSNPRIDEVDFTWRFRDLDDYWAFLIDAAGAIAMVLRKLDAKEVESVREELGGRIKGFAGHDGIALPAMSLVASAS
jgi:ubiquinone/menaquinone biosynthesis C-methylase UbiE